MNKVSQEKHVTLNRPALWQPTSDLEIGSRTYTANRTYQDNKVIGISSQEKPITRYVQTFTKGKKDFSLFMFSDETDIKKVSDFFANLVKKTTVEDVSKALITASSDGFTYLDTYYKGAK